MRLDLITLDPANLQDKGCQMEYDQIVSQTRPEKRLAM